MLKHFAIDPLAIKEVWNYCTEGVILPSTAMDKEEGIELKFEKHTNIILFQVCALCFL